MGGSSELKAGLQGEGGAHAILSPMFAALFRHPCSSDMHSDGRRLTIP